MNLENVTPQHVVKAHQYLYYVLGTAVWSDYDYDKYCRKYGIEGGGGSDCAEHYSEDEKKLARLFLEGYYVNPEI